MGSRVEKTKCRCHVEVAGTVVSLPGEFEYRESPAEAAKKAAQKYRGMLKRFANDWSLVVTGNGSSCSFKRAQLDL